MRRGSRIALWAAGIGIPLGAAAAWGLLFSPWLSIEDVVVSIEGDAPASAGPLTPGDIEAVAGIPRGTGLLRLSTPDVAARIAGLPQVAAVDIERDLPGTVRITVVRRPPVAAISEGAEVRLLAADGTVVATVPSLPDDLPRLEADPEHRADVLAVAAALPATVRDRTVAISGSTRNDITVLLDDGTVVRWGSADSGELKASVLAALLDEPDAARWAFIDVSAPTVPATSETVPGAAPAT